MGSRSRLNPFRPVNDWQHLRLILAVYDLEIGDHPSTLARELFDESLLLVRLKCGEEIPSD